MASPRHRASRLAALLAVGALGFLGSIATATSAGAAPVELVGTFVIDPGSCQGAPSGSYFRMILPSGTATGPFIENQDSSCGDKTYTLFTPGADGGLVSGGYQPAPDPGFDGDGNSTANRIIQPVKFFGKRFSVSTNPTDLQVGQAVPAPVLRADGSTISGDLTAFDATWNREAFNQGAPKPGGGSPGNTKAVGGTYDAATGRFTLTWSSQIVSGPFDNFTGQWHLEGTFRPAGAGNAGAPVAVPAAPTASGTTGSAVAPVAADASDDLLADDTSASTVAPASGDDEEAALVPAGATVTDESFKVPTALVVIIALLGIAAVVVLVVLDRRPDTEGAAS
ncbi:MAG: hypothetical protein M3Z03_09890 [Actinomycetota bacterium]|nr:hypothetical protein [Actinomycetota bacterium]